MEFIKIRNVKNPERDVQENAGIDFYIPEKNSFSDEELKSFGTEVSFEDNKIIIYPHGSVIIPSGIMSKFANNIALIANNKSGIATKKQLIFGASVIDSSYQGEWHYHLINTSDDYQVVECGTKVIQFIPHLISTEEVEVLDLSPEEFYKDSVSSRGEGWQGSTGIK